jgi:hypothetical protein
MRIKSGIFGLSCEDYGTESPKIHFVRQTISRQINSKKRHLWR